MKTTGIFETHVYNIKAPSIGKPFKLVFFGDVHKGAPLHSDEVWDKFLRKYKGQKDCYFLGMGDYQDFMSTSERNAVNASNFHEATRDAMEELAQNLTDEFAKDISWMGDRLIGLIDGNHYWEFMNGESSTMRLAKKLNTKYLGVSALIRLSIDVHGSRTTLDIFAHHGKGAARLAGSPFNTVEQMAEGCEADIFVMGHDHSLGVIPKTRLYGRLNSKSGIFDFVERRIMLVRSGSALKGYVKGKSSYIADGGHKPKPLGFPEIEITPVRPEKDGNRDFYCELRGVA